MKNCDAKNRIVASSGDVDGDDGAGAVLVEEWVEYFQEERFRARHCLGKLGLQAKITHQIDVSFSEGIRSRKVYRRSLDTELQAEKLDHAVFEMKTAVQIGDGTPGFFVARLALAVAAK